MKADNIVNSFAGLLNSLEKAEVTKIWGNLVDSKLEPETVHASREALKVLSRFNDKPVASPYGYSFTANDDHSQKVDYLGRTFIVTSRGNSPTTITQENNPDFRIELPLNGDQDSTKIEDFVNVILETASSVVI